MATQGRLATALSVANQNQLIYKVPDGSVVTATISFTNTGTSAATVRAYISTNDNPARSDAIEFDSVVSPGGVIERSCMPMGQAERFIVNCSSSDVAIRIAGFEAPNT